MPATAERLSAERITELRERLSIRLTPEGAFNLYYIDVAALMDELQRVYGEQNAARAYFEEDGASAPENASLRDLAEAWKANATGYWEKAQTKKLRAEIAELRDSVYGLTHDLEIQTEATDEAKTKLGHTHQQLLLTEDQLIRQAEQHSAELQAEQAEQVGLRDEVSTLNAALTDCQVRCEQVLAMAQAQDAERRRLAAELLREALVLVGE